MTSLDTFAEKIAPYRHPRPSNVKVAGDRDKLTMMTADELEAQILADIAELGILPKLLKLVEGGSHKLTDGVAKGVERHQKGQPP